MKYFKKIMEHISILTPTEEGKKILDEIQKLLGKEKDIPYSMSECTQDEWLHFILEELGVDTYQISKVITKISKPFLTTVNFSWKGIPTMISSKYYI